MVYSSNYSATILRAFILLIYFTYIVKTLPSHTGHEFSKMAQDGTNTIIIDGVKTKATVKIHTKGNLETEKTKGRFLFLEIGKVFVILKTHK